VSIAESYLQQIIFYKDDPSSRRLRRWAEKRYTNLVHFSEVARGGHFALLEQPGLLVEDIRATIR
jgi:pimeloyl-ACP methyl ester carboxylesterase